MPPLKPKPKPTFFRTAAALARWFDKYGATRTELWIGYYKKASGKGGLTYKPALDEALCVGWIDGVINGIDDACYMQRYTPRTRKSIWSAVNIRRVGELSAEGRMKPAGIATFEARDLGRAGLYSHENHPQEFPPEFLKAFKANKKAWAFFESQPPGYRRTATFLVVSPKREETRARRLEHLIEQSAQGRRIQQLVSPAKRKSAAG
ncbi:MAG: YdeI/OmpD-associated family protein [Gemmatimonadaceae bacterium]